MRGQTASRCFLLRMSCARRAGYFDEVIHYCEDQEDWLRCYGFGAKVGINPDGLVLYRKHGDSSTRDMTRMYVHDSLMQEKIADMLRSLADFARNDGKLTPAERGLIERLGSAFGFNREAVGDQIAERATGVAQPTLEACYVALGVTPAVSDADLAKAWRRLLAQHHPDKLQGQGADAQALKLAETRTRDLRAAYERILAARARTI